MNKVHMMLQGKGGVGKSTSAALLAQYKKDQLGTAALCLDIDPQNRTFSGWKGLGVEHIDIASHGDVDRDRFDLLMNAIAKSRKDVIVDTGSNGYLGLTSYMISDGVPEGITALDRELVIHTVIIGGQAGPDTMDGLTFLAESFPDVPLVAWLNPMSGPVSNETDGPFADLAEIQDLGDRLAIIELPDYTSGRATTFSRDLERAIVAQLTFQEAREAFKEEVMVAWRMKMMRDKFFDAVAAADPGKVLF